MALSTLLFRSASTCLSNTLHSDIMRPILASCNGLCTQIYRQQRLEMRSRPLMHKQRTGSAAVAAQQVAGHHKSPQDADKEVFDPPEVRWCISIRFPPLGRCIASPTREAFLFIAGDKWAVACIFLMRQGWRPAYGWAKVPPLPPRTRTHACAHTQYATHSVLQQTQHQPRGNQTSWHRTRSVLPTVLQAPQPRAPLSTPTGLRAAGAGRPQLARGRCTVR